MAEQFDLSGIKFGRLKVIEYVGRNTHDKSMWRCACDCGKDVIVTGIHIKSGATKSCGCLRREVVGLAFSKHGYSQSREYKIWKGIKQRCLNKKSKFYSLYGGRGITIFSGWINNYEAFLSHIGLAPTIKHSIDRINNSKGYEPGNIRWATQKEQTRNTRQNKIVCVDGKNMVLTDACSLHNISMATVGHRLKIGWSIERALKTQPRKGGCNGD